MAVTVSRIFSSSAYFQPTDNADPIRSVVTESQDAVVVAWCIKPGQEISRHYHPLGQDTWTIVAGTGRYYLDNTEISKPITKGDVVVAHVGEIHGVYNDGLEPLMIISVVSPADAGYQIVN